VQGLLLNLLNGISFGCILFLLASGLTLIFGVMGILNLTHGAFYMLGAYVGWTIAADHGVNFGLAVLAGGLTACVVGLIIERGFLRHLYNNLNEQTLVTFGFVLILTNLAQWIWGPLERPPFAPPAFSHAVHFLGISYPATRLSIIVTALLVGAILWLIDRRTRIGAIVRAGKDDKETLSALGVNVGQVSMALFGVGAFVAGAAGVVGAQILGVNLQLSLSVLLFAVVVVVVGGLGSVAGTLVAGMLIGIIDAFGKAYFPQFAMFTIYLAMIVVLVGRPSGLLGPKT